VSDDYKTSQEDNPLEAQLWQKFWEYALNAEAHREGIKNAQIEASGSKFIPGLLYTLRIEHDGGHPHRLPRDTVYSEGRKILY